MVLLYINTTVKVNPILVGTDNVKLEKGVSTIKSSVRKSRTTL
jgi:hypothetical protein